MSSITELVTSSDTGKLCFTSCGISCEPTETCVVNLVLRTCDCLPEKQTVLSHGGLITLFTLVLIFAIGFVILYGRRPDVDVEAGAASNAEDHTTSQPVHLEEGFWNRVVDKVAKLEDQVRIQVLGFSMGTLASVLMLVAVFQHGSRVSGRFHLQTGITARSHHGAAVVGSTVVVLGGFGNDVLDDMWQSDVRFPNAWTRMETLQTSTPFQPQPVRCAHAMLPIPPSLNTAGDFLVLGGFDGFTHTNKICTGRLSGMNKVSWSCIDAPWSGRSLHIAFVFGAGPDTSVVVMGGKNDVSVFGDIWINRCGESGEPGIQAFAQWSRLPSSNFPERTESCAVVFDDGSVVLLGGRNQFDFFNDVHASTTSGFGSWTRKAATTLWEARAGHSVAKLSNSVYLLGGYRSTGGFDSRFEKIYYFSDVWVSPTQGISWRLVTGSAPWQPRAHSALLFFGQSENTNTLLIGGHSAATLLDVWTSMIGSAASWRSACSAERGCVDLDVAGGICDAYVQDRPVIVLYLSSFFSFTILDAILMQYFSNPTSCPQRLIRTISMATSLYALLATPFIMWTLWYQTKQIGDDPGLSTPWQQYNCFARMFLWAPMLIVLFQVIALQRTYKFEQVHKLRFFSKNSHNKVHDESVVMASLAKRSGARAVSKAAHLAGSVLDGATPSASRDEQRPQRTLSLATGEPSSSTQQDQRQVSDIEDAAPGDGRGIQERTRKDAPSDSEAATPRSHVSETIVAGTEHPPRATASEKYSVDVPSPALAEDKAAQDENRVLRFYVACWLFGARIIDPGWKKWWLYDDPFFTCVVCFPMISYSFALVCIFFTHVVPGVMWYFPFVALWMSVLFFSEFLGSKLLMLAAARAPAIAEFGMCVGRCIGFDMSVFRARYVNSQRWRFAYLCVVMCGTWIGRHYERQSEATYITPVSTQLKRHSFAYFAETNFSSLTSIINFLRSMM